MLTRPPLLPAIIGLFLLLSTCFAAPMMQQEPIKVETITEGPSGFTVAMEFQPPALIATNNRLRVDLPGAMPDFEAVGPALPAIKRLVAVPDGYSVRAQIRNIREERFDVDHAVPRDHIDEMTLHGESQQSTVEVGEPGWMRWMRVAPVVIRPARYLQDEHQIACAERIELEFEFVPDGSASGRNPDPDRYWSQAFEDVFQSMLLNGYSSAPILPSGRVVQRGSYIIITDGYLEQYLTDFAEWKRRKGFDVVVEPMYHQGVTNEDIKEYIQDAYDNWERPPEYVLLVGDVDAPGIHLPTFYIRNPDYAETDPTDQPYVMLEGDDYFIDAFIGRISCDSPNPGELQRALARYLRHERDMQNLGDLDMGAYHRATVFGGNYDDSGELTSSPVETCRWLAERLRERGYDVEEFYWEHPGDNVNPGPIVESINRRINILAYRGWGDANGPHFPTFHKENLEELYNDPLLPISTFFVCNTGDFHNDDHMQCFGEYSILQGTRRTPCAGLVFFGPSDLYTKTRYNNPLLGGFYFSLLYRNIRNFAPLTLAAKMELWDGYPHKRERGREVEFYTYIYNIIGDPEVTVYLDAPFTLEVEYTEQFYIGDSYTAFTVRNQAGNPVYGAMVTLRKTDETGISVLTDADGLALVPVQLDSEGDLEVTVIAKQAFPYLATIPVSVAERNIGFAGVVVSNGDDDRLITGTPVDLTVTLRNTGINNSRGVIATLSSVIDEVEIVQASADFGDIAKGEFVAANGPFRVILSHEIPSADHVPFLLQITDDQQNSYHALFRLPISTGVVKYVSYEFEGGVINPGEAADLVVTVMNGGDMDLTGLTAEITTYDNSITIVDNEAEFGDIGAGETVDCSGNPFRIEAEDGAADGRQVELIVRLTDSNDRRVNTMPFKIIIGDVEPEDPIGPDGYGYYAYESCDDSDRYPQAPEFDWIELDPDYGGEGALLQRFVDDTTYLYELPFTFVFYGEEYDSIAVCSNGWISFEATNLYYNFRNWGMPSPLGPHSMIAPFWEDLVGDSIGSDMRDSLDIFTRYDEEEDRFIIEWSRVNARTSVEDHLETFEVILFNPTAEGHQTETGDGEILMQYLDVIVVDRTETNFATVGIQDWLHRRGLEITYANIYHPAAAELEPERAILFTTIPADGYLDLTDDVDLQPVVFGLEHPSPNPFNSIVRIGYNLPGAGEMRLELLDVNGRLVRVLQSGEVGGGSHSLMLNAGLLPSGLYIVRLEAAGLTAQKKLVLLR